jgi:hypothetical protein
LRRGCRLIHIIKAKAQGKERGERRNKQLLDNLKEKEDTGNRKKKIKIARSGDLALAKSMDLS